MKIVLIIYDMVSLQIEIVSIGHARLDIFLVKQTSFIMYCEDECRNIHHGLLNLIIIVV